MSISLSSWDSSSISTLFSSLSTSSSSSSSLDTSILSDYAAIKNGSYSKLVKAYYKSDSSDGTSTSTTVSGSPSVLKSESAELSEDISALQEENLWKTTTSTDENGKTTETYDTDSIYKAVSAYVSDYNSLVKSAADSDSTGILTSVNSMVGYSKVNSSLLSTIGITVKSDNTLSIDEEEFKSADMSTAKELFGTNGSYGYQVAASSAMVNSYAKALLSTGYTSSGTYTYSEGSILNSYL